MFSAATFGPNGCEGREPTRRRHVEGQEKGADSFKVAGQLERCVNLNTETPMEGQAKRPQDAAEATDGRNVAYFAGKREGRGGVRMDASTELLRLFVQGGNARFFLGGDVSAAFLQWCEARRSRRLHSSACEPCGAESDAALKLDGT